MSVKPVCRRVVRVAKVLEWEVVEEGHEEFLDGIGGIHIVCKGCQMEEGAVASAST